MSVVVVFVFGWWDASEFVEESPMVEPVDPLEGGVLEVVEASPWPTVSDEFGLVEADDRLGERIVIAVSSGSDRGDDPVFGETFGVADRQVLHSPIRVVDQWMPCPLLTNRDWYRGMS